MDRKWNKMKQNYMLPTGNSLKIWGHTQTQSERIEKDTPWMEVKRKQGYHTDIKVDFKTKAVQETKKVIYNDKGANWTRRCNICI